MSGLGVMALGLIAGVVVVVVVLVGAAFVDMVGNARKRKGLERKERPRLR